MQVLLVEDHEGEARMNWAMLERGNAAPIQCVQVSTLAEAITAFGHATFDIVILDLNLPDSSGLETLIRLREIAPSVPIVVVSALGDDELAVTAVRAGAQEVLLKGNMSSATLARAVRHALARHHAALTSVGAPPFSFGVFTVDGDGMVKSVGSGMYRLLGELPDTFEREVPLDSMFRESEREHVHTMLRECIDAGTPSHAILAANVSAFDHLLLSLFPSPAGAHGILAPAGEHMQIPADLVQSEEKYRILVEHSQDGVFIVIDGKFAFANRALANMLGYEAHEIVGMDIDRLLAPEDKTEVLQNYRKRMSGQPAPEQYDFRMLHRDGSRIFVLLSVGRVVFMGRMAAMGTVKNITRQKRVSDLFALQRALAIDLGAVSNFEEMGARVLSSVLRIDGIDVAALYRCIDEDFLCVAFRGVLDDFSVEKDSTIVTLFQLSISDRHPVFLDEQALSGDEFRNRLPRGIRSLAVLPVFWNGKIVAVLFSASLTMGAMDDDVRQTLEAMSSMLGGVLSRVTMEEALKESELLYRAVVERSHDAILIFSGSRLLFVNDRVSELTGYTRAELLAMDPMSIVHPEDRERLQRFSSARFKGEEAPAMYDARFLAKDGSLRIGEFASTLIRYQGNVAALISVRDITQRRLHEEQMRHADTLIRAAGFAAECFLGVRDWEDEIFAVLEHFGQAAAVSRVALYRIIDRTDGVPALQLHSMWCRDEAESAALPEIQILGGALQRWEKCFAAGDPIADAVEYLPHSERELLSSQGIRSVAALPVFAGENFWGCIRFDEFNTPRTWLMSEIEAMTVCAETLGAAIARRMVDRELVLSKERVEAADAIRQAFIANMSHEIRTPLNIIIGYIGLVTETLSPDQYGEMSEFISAINDAGRRLIRTVDSVMNISRIQRGDMHPATTSVRLDELIDGCAEEFKTSAEDKALTLTIDNHIGPVSIAADAHFLRESIEHLLDNAVKFTNQGCITLRLRDEGGAVHLDVIDTGIGIDEKNFEQIFEPYVQEDMGYSRAFEGIGLGLTLTRLFLDAHGASIVVSSEKGAGTTFTIRFPASLRVDPLGTAHNTAED